MFSEHNHLRISENYNLGKEEENDLINYINQLLNEFESQLSLIDMDTVYYSILPLGRKICETMMELMLKKEGYSIADSIPFMKVIRFSFTNGIIKRKNYRTLDNIRRYSNIAIHGDELNYDYVMSFLNEFSRFIMWFGKSSSDYEEDMFHVDGIILKIDSIKNDMSYANGSDPIKVKSENVEYVIYKLEEKENMNDLNKLLDDYAEQLKCISSEKKFYYAFLASTISEVMLKLLLKNEGLYNPNERYGFYQYIEILYEHDVIPRECNKFLHQIRRYRNEFIHGKEHSNRLLLSFLKAFNYFLQWFDNHSYIRYQNKFQIEECCELINSLDYDEKNDILVFTGNDERVKLKTDELTKLRGSQTNDDIARIKKQIITLKKEKDLKDSELQKRTSNECEVSMPMLKIVDSDEIIGRLTADLKTKEETHQIQIDTLNRANDKLLRRLDETSRQLERCLDILEKIDAQGKRVESKIDELHHKIDNISSQITTIQSFTERQLRNAQSSEEIEKIVGTFIDECIENIMSHAQNFTETQNYEIEKTKLKYSLGEGAWDKLCEKSRTFLITSKVMYNHLITMDDIIDYSGICVLVTKALEVELHKRFFTGFLEYLKGKYGRNYEKYHTALLHQHRTPLFSEAFTMGDIAFVMCFKENRYDNDDQKSNNELRLMEYCRECVFSRHDENRIRRLLKKYASSIEEIRKNYRNPSAHTNEIKRIDAEECFNLVLDVEKLLKQMLDSFDS